MRLPQRRNPDRDLTRANSTGLRQPEGNNLTSLASHDHEELDSLASNSGGPARRLRFSPGGNQASIRERARTYSAACRR
jgi:hypothetical protein